VHLQLDNNVLGIAPVLADPGDKLADYAYAILVGIDAGNELPAAPVLNHFLAWQDIMRANPEVLFRCHYLLSGGGLQSLLTNATITTGGG